MLTDLALRNLKRKPTRDKVTDRDGMYVVVYPTGVISFRYDYRLNGRRETFVIGRYPPPGEVRRRIAGVAADVPSATVELRRPGDSPTRWERPLQ